LQLKYLFTAKNISKEREIEKNIMLDILNAQEMDRSRLAKDLHDSIGQQLSAIKLYLGSMQNTYSKDTFSTSVLLNCNNILNNISQEIRNICFDLMPRTLHDGGLYLAIKELSHQINYTGKIKVIVKIEKEKSLIPSTFELVVYRVIQEFINNSIKHSDCTKITIAITNILDKTHIIIKDNGKGFNVANKSKGMGLLNMENRIKSINGDIKINSTINRGTQLQILL
jgi:signal transduction histidine kinase